jgi:Spy/CpxP family protein refolding chaperone
MKKLALTLAAAALTAMTFAATAPASAQNLSVSVGAGGPHRTYHRPVVRSRVVVRHDNGRHLGWYKHRSPAKKIIVVKHRRHG